MKRAAVVALITVISLSSLIDGDDTQEAKIFRVSDADGQPCLIATLRASIAVRYRTLGLDRTRFLTNTFYIPDDVESSGQCYHDNVTLQLSWAEGNYSMAFIFKSNETDALNTVWYASAIEMTFVTGNGTEYPRIVRAGPHSVRSEEGQSLMAAPSNFSYQCVSQENVDLFEILANGTVDQTSVDAVRIGLYEVKVQVGSLRSNSTFGTAVRCLRDLSFGVNHQHVVTVAIAAGLASVILIIVIGHAILKTRSKLRYTTME
ncbi:hypothetical protein CAPTEDRAFT_222373 [Capitella teleta]|uniref:Lysosome-associated membrane glycoprotein 5 n=1 Tax=Capitella teleta TaxID=283909 RepID=R7U686_CAPTE|nr:hypothetical protein CAPTEDRAFT_222373 [Capitella teleta]|eukprot:ELT99201.1 hypothetical protein CAPTEDRAFT_222373 [Capitella teleta]